MKGISEQTVMFMMMMILGIAMFFIIWNTVKNFKGAEDSEESTTEPDEGITSFFNISLLIFIILFVSINEKIIIKDGVVDKWMSL